MSQDGSDDSSPRVIIRREESPLEHETQLGDGKTIIYAGEPMLGEGSYARVYPCMLKEILDFGRVAYRRAAVRYIEVHMAPGRNRLQNELEQEFRIWRDLSQPGTQHDNVLQMLAVEAIQTEDGRVLAWAVTELMDMTLEQLIFEDREFNQTCTYKSLMQIAEKICEGLAHLHTNRFIHYDLKPSNVLISKNANRRLGIKISGSSFTRKLDDGRSSMSVSYRGKCVYMAPEIAQAQGAFIKTENRISNAVDIYSLGVLLWVLFNRRKPLDFQSVSRDIGKSVRISHGVENEDIWCRAPDEICDLIESCLLYTYQENPDKSHGRPSVSELQEKILQMYDKPWAGERPPTYLQESEIAMMNLRKVVDEKEKLMKEKEYICKELAKLSQL